MESIDIGGGAKAEVKQGELRELESNFRSFMGRLRKVEGRIQEGISELLPFETSDREDSGKEDEKECIVASFSGILVEGREILADLENDASALEGIVK